MNIAKKNGGENLTLLRRQAVRQRLTDILCWHVTGDDSALSDHDLVAVAWMRYCKHQETYITDVSE